MHTVLTEDGRVYSGIPAEENERQLKLRVANREAAVTIAKSQTMQTAARVVQKPYSTGINPGGGPDCVRNRG